MHQILADHDKQISIQHLRHQQQLGAVMWIAMRSHTLPMSSNRFWLSVAVVVPSALVLPELTVLEPPLHTVKSSDGLTDRNDREDQRRRLALLATELSSHDDYYQPCTLWEHTARTNETTNSNILLASCNLTLLACCMTILLMPMPLNRRIGS